MQTRAKMLDRRSAQIILPFTFWEPADSSSMQPKGLYEMRSYTVRVSRCPNNNLLLKPGSQ